MLVVPISVGELVDKITILEIKLSKIEEEEKLSFIQKELNLLKTYYDTSCDNLKEELKLINLKLWEYEDRIREFYKLLPEYKEDYIYFAKKIHQTNDERFRVKSEINKLTKSTIVEQKSY